MTEKLLGWFMDHQDEIPTRMHAREAGEGGTPRWTAEFREWIDGARKLSIKTVTEVCTHPLRKEGQLCESCGITGQDGAILVETGIRRREIKTYRWPMRRAIEAVRGAVVPDGMPSFASTLMALSASGGDVKAASTALADRYPAMGDEVAAREHMAAALRRVKNIYTTER